MATQVGLTSGEPRQSLSLAEFIDRWIYVGMALFLIAVILVGFVPDSFKRVADIGGGGRPDFLWQAHFHALTMASWMAMLLLQTVLMATGRKQWHFQLGMIGMVLAPTLVIAGLMLVPANFAARIAFAEGGGPEAQAALAKTLYGMTNTVITQLRSGICFSVLVCIGLVARKHDAGLHKRLMILATIAPIGAATARMPFLYDSVPTSPISTLLWPTVCVAPMFLWDLYRLHRIHVAYWIYLAVAGTTGVIAMLLWSSPGWHAFAGAILHG